jgi:hypothetical protein
MASAAERYEQYRSSVGEEARDFLAGLESQSDAEVRARLARKEFGRRTHLALTSLDFRKKIREEADDEKSMQRINSAIKIDGRSATGSESGKRPFLSRLMDVIRG